MSSLIFRVRVSSDFCLKDLTNRDLTLPSLDILNKDSNAPIFTGTSVSYGAIDVVLMGFQH